MTEHEPAAPEARPRLITVAAVLIGTAMLFSYLGAYAIAGAMATSDIIAPWPPGHDPRPRWMAIGFVGLLILFSALAGLFRFFSQRQLRRIDAMTQD